MKCVKKLVTFILFLIFSISSFASVVTDNDGAAFITKAEFDSLRNSFQSQIDQYNVSLDSKIDGAIAQYLAGMVVANKEELQPLLDIKVISWIQPNTQMQQATPNWNIIPTPYRINFWEMYNETSGANINSLWVSEYGGNTGNEFISSIAYPADTNKYYFLEWEQVNGIKAVTKFDIWSRITTSLKMSSTSSYVCIENANGFTPTKDTTYTINRYENWLSDGLYSLPGGNGQWRYCGGWLTEKPVISQTLTNRQLSYTISTKRGRFDCATGTESWAFTSTSTRNEVTDLYTPYFNMGQSGTVDLRDSMFCDYDTINYNDYPYWNRETGLVTKTTVIDVDYANDRMQTTWDYTTKITNPGVQPWLLNDRACIKLPGKKYEIDDSNSSATATWENAYAPVVANIGISQRFYEGVPLIRVSKKGKVKIEKIKPTSTNGILLIKDDKFANVKYNTSPISYTIRNSSTNVISTTMSYNVYYDLEFDVEAGKTYYIKSSNTNKWQIDGKIILATN